ncbi:MAG: Formamidopyrimidine-DNA glycosylase [Thermoleophilia bacterium]|nr:Formamidopyrimidine-DNA glycosylase [Thermoleophilia bacterium]
MPELPEVERARSVIADHALDRKIVGVDDTDTWVCRPHAPGEIAEALTGHFLRKACRRGKTMWCELSGDAPVLGLHLGMSGRIVVDDFAGGDPRPSAGGDDADDADAERWTRFTLHFADGGSLMLFDKRRLGRVRLDPDLSKLGPDALDITREQFRERIGRGSVAIKARLLDQSALAGVGNLLADETLWQARIRPGRNVDSMREDELDELRRVLRRATRAAIKHGGVHTGELIEHRGKDGHCPRCGAGLQRGTVGGRTTWWCPEEQR